MSERVYVDDTGAQITQYMLGATASAIPERRRKYGPPEWLTIYRHRSDVDALGLSAVVRPDAVEAISVVHDQKGEGWRVTLLVSDRFVPATSKVDDVEVAQQYAEALRRLLDGPEPVYPEPFADPFPEGVAS